MSKRVEHSVLAALLLCGTTARPAAYYSNNVGIRRALLGAFSQADMMAAVAGEDRSMWKTGVGFVTPTSPLANDAGMEALNSPRDLAQVKRELTAAGYNGEKFVFLVPTEAA